MSFSQEEQRECCLMMSIGCDRETTCHYMGKTVEQLRQQLASDEDFRTRVLRAEATPEFTHLRNLYNAAKDEKNWRVSVWWLEHCVPDRFGRRTPDSLTVAQLNDFLDVLAKSIAEQVHDPRDRQNLLDKFEEVSQQLADEPNPAVRKQAIETEPSQDSLRGAAS